MVHGRTAQAKHVGRFVTDDPFQRLRADTTSVAGVSKIMSDPVVGSGSCGSDTAHLQEVRVESVA